VPASPLAAEALFRVGEHHYAASRFAEAAGAYAEAAAKATDPALKEKALHKIGWCAFKKGDYPAGAAAFDRRWRRSPGAA
jgi:outer membrane protein assembly factor BamD (BamD/ComL family)